MRHYLFKIAYNKVAMAEDRPQPAAYDTFDEAKKNFNTFFSQNILAPTIGWCMAFVVAENGVTVIEPDTWEDPNIGEYYGTFIVNGTVNDKTGEPWKIEDVPERFRAKTQTWINEHPREEQNEQPAEQTEG